MAEDTFRPDIAAEQITKLVRWLQNPGLIPAAWTRRGVLEELADTTEELAGWSHRELIEEVRSG